MQLLAHAGEDHGDGIESAQHLLENDPFVVVPIALVVMILIPFFLSKLISSPTIPVIVGLLELFIVGILAYSTVPVLSIVSLSAGFLLSLVFAFGGLTK